MKTPIMLRRYRTKPCEVMAIILDGNESRWPYHVTTYEKVGQHGTGFYSHLVRMTTKATTEEPDAAALLRELERVGYTPEVVSKKPRSYRRRRTLGE